MERSPIPIRRVFHLALRTRDLPFWLRYGTTAALVLCTVPLRWMLFGTDPRNGFLIFFPAIFATGLLFDHGTGIFAALLSTVLALLLFVPPLGSLAVADPGDAISVVLFAAIAVFSAVLFEAMHVVFRDLLLGGERLELANSRLEQANQQLVSVERERTTMLREAVHRARNDLQRLAATIALQAGAAEQPAVRDALQVASGRIAALARINLRLDLHREDGHAVVDGRAFLHGLVEDLDEAMIGLRPVSLEVSGGTHPLSMQRAVPVGLIVNELVINALKHAFPDDREGRVRIDLSRRGDELVLSVEDNGVGMLTPTAAPVGDAPEASVNGRARSGLGRRLVRALAVQLSGHFEVGPGPDGRGTRCVVRFPVAEAAG